MVDFFLAPSGLCPTETTLGRGLTLVVDSDSCFLVDVWGGRVGSRKTNVLVAGCFFYCSSPFERCWLVVLVRAGV
jgi:hypothetical protein